jgi:hypothetical protein
MKNVKLFEQFVNETYIFDTEDVDINTAIEKINRALEPLIPYKNVTKGIFGNDTIMVLAVFEPKNEWTNGIMENSNYFRMAIYSDGKMEVFTQSLYAKNVESKYENRLPVKFRKSKAKNIDDAAARLVKYVNEVKKFY